MGLNLQETQKAGTAVRFWVLSGKTHVVPKAVIEKAQADPAPTNVEGVEGFVGIWGFGMTFNAHLA